MERFARCDAVLRDARGTAFTGAVARIEYRGVPVFERAYGRTRENDGACDVYVDTRFDLASLTKLFMATCALRLVAQGHLALDESLAIWLQEWRGTAHERITLRMLLAHTSGMQSGADYRTLLDQHVERAALERPLAASPGERVIYSDLGFIALGLLIARATGASLASATHELFPSRSLGFSPSERERPAIPATEDHDWRGRVQGVVHDEKAFLMGGCAGHAGIFATAADVGAMTQAYLAAWSGRAPTLLPTDLAIEATREAAYDPVLRRGLGWALKTGASNSCGDRFGFASFGHTGFVGTCVWADPQRDVIGILLTNSVYFGRGDSRPLRAAFYDAVIEDLEA
ncbi:MAG: serine hydrolase domain-containing protein [Vulcanimicrobiaceae bacterium]